MSDMDGVSSVSDIIKQAIAWVTVKTACFVEDEMNKNKNLWKKGLWGRLSAESARRRV